MEKRVLGVDIGGVIIDKANDNTDTSLFGNNYLNTTAVKDAFMSLKELNIRFGGEVCIVSKCGSNTERKTKEWLQHHDFPVV